jgi:hypothetical protein
MKRLVLLLALAAPAAQPVRADDPALPNAGFPASRYEPLWTKSPFAVATSEVSQETSPDYMLVGIANVEGISYASVIETKTPQEHFLISSDKPTRGLKLTSITRNHDGSDTYAVVQKDGQSITLKLEQPPATAVVATAPPTNTVAMPGGMTPQITMPGAAPSFPATSGARPPARFRHPLIHLPPPPAQQQQPAPPAPAPAPPAPAPPQ